MSDRRETGDDCEVSTSLLQDLRIKSSHDVLTEDPQLSSEPALAVEE